MLFMTTSSDRLRKHLDLPLFAGCTTRELRRIDTLSTEVSRPAGQVLCRKGDVGRECFVLVDGDIAVDTGSSYITVGRGVMLGEITLLSPHCRRTATLTALTDITIRVCSRTEFSQLMAGVPTVAHRVLREAARRLIENAQTPAA
jgi:CRP-like cAMP-binding protein